MFNCKHEHKFVSLLVLTDASPLKVGEQGSPVIALILLIIGTVCLSRKVVTREWRVYPALLSLLKNDIDDDVIISSPCTAVVTMVIVNAVKYYICAPAFSE